MSIWVSRFACSSLRALNARHAILKQSFVELAANGVDGEVVWRQNGNVLRIQHELLHCFVFVAVCPVQLLVRRITVCCSSRGDC